MNKNVPLLTSNNVRLLMNRNVRQLMNKNAPLQMNSNAPLLMNKNVQQQTNMFAPQHTRPYAQEEAQEEEVPTEEVLDMGEAQQISGRNLLAKDVLTDGREVHSFSTKAVVI